MVEHFWPTSLDQALDILKTERPIPCAGGRGLTGLGNGERPLLFLSRVPELGVLYQDEVALHLGAGLTLEELLDRWETPELLKTVCAQTAAPAVRGQVTLGGALVGGGAGSDLALACTVAEATLRIAGADGERTTALRSFYRGQGQVDLTDRELLVEVLLPLDRLEPFYYRAVDGETVGAQFRWDGDRLAVCALAFGGRDMLVRPELDKTLAGKSRGEVEAGLSTYQAAWEDAITLTAKGGEDTALIRLGLLHGFLEDLQHGEV